MEYTEVAGIDVPVARVGLGTWAIGGWMWGGTHDAESVRTIRSALERGLNLVDTAPVYGFGHSEKLVGKALAQHGRREEVVLATKVGLEWRKQDGKTQVSRNSSPQRIRGEIEDSLRRLGTDYIDIYQVHWPDHDTPCQETAETLLDLKERGLIRAIGVSNYSVEQIEEFRRGAPLAAVQPPFNLFERDIESELLPYAHRRGLTTLTYGALSRGLLSGKMTRDREFQGDDLRKNDPKFQSPRYERYLEAVERLDRLAQERYGRRVIHLAVRWLLDKGADVPLWGARRPDQLDAVDQVWGWHLDQGAMEEIDRILDETIEHPVGPGFMAPPS